MINKRKPDATIKTDERCPVEATAEIIGRKWISLIIRDLANGPQRFGELQHSMRISPRILSMRLQELEQNGLISRQVFAEVPPRTEYTLTEKGELFLPLIDEMRRVGKQILAQPVDSKS
jgi:DNA-binding HxlR family transcriptional regulator